MRKITYIKGDATKPKGDDKRIIAHCCNNKGGWGSGFVLALNAMSPLPKKAYLELAEEYKGNIPLGHVQIVQANDSSSLYVANMIGQDGTVDKENPTDIPPVRYEAIRQALEGVKDIAEKFEASVHAPMFGSDLAGGNWEVIELIIFQVFKDSKVPVTIYEYDPEPKEQPYLESKEYGKPYRDIEFNPKYVDKYGCKCGHPYERHFDSYEDNAPVGCKYCICQDFIPATEEDVCTDCDGSGWKGHHENGHEKSCDGCYGEGIKSSVLVEQQDNAAY
jgi:O-acetyl-ADP-ribose deacetylase (regulator of RNase III)